MGRPQQKVAPPLPMIEKEVELERSSAVAVVSPTVARSPFELAPPSIRGIDKPVAILAQVSTTWVVDRVFPFFSPFGVLPAW